MFYYAVLACITLNAVLANESSNYTFNYKLPQVTADMAVKLKDKLKHRIFDVAKAMEQECKYVRGMAQYGFAIEMALVARSSDCSVDNDISQLETYKQLYQSSLKTCYEGVNSTNTYDKLIDGLVSEIQTIDQTAKTEADSCSGDQECEKQAYETTHKSLTDLYVSKNGEIRVTEDQAVSQALSYIKECMVSKVSDSLKEMYLATEKLQTCIATAA